MMGQSCTHALLIRGASLFPHTDRPADWSGVGVCSGAQRPWRIPGHGPAQAAGSGNQNMAHDTTSQGQIPRSQSSELQPHGLMWTTPVQRRGSIPQSFKAADGGATPKHSSSISSITITSRRVVRSSSLPDAKLPPQVETDHQTDSAKCVNTQKPRLVTPQRKAVMVKVTEQKTEIRSVLQHDKNSLTAGGGCSSPSSSMTTRRRPDIATSNLFGQDLQNRTSSPVNIATRDHLAPAIPRVTTRAIYSPIPSILATQESHQPVVLRRKPTIVKVEQRESCREEALEKLEHRHSYAEGFRATSSATYTSNPSHTNTEPLMPNEPSVAGSLSQAFSSVQPSMSNEKVKEVHRSTLSFQLSSPSNRPPLNNPQSLQGLRRRRPASCYGSMFSLSEPSTAASKDTGFQSTTSTLPQKTNIDPASSNASSSNRRWSTGGAGSCDRIYPGRDSSAGDGGQRQRELALLRNQQPFTLIKVPESSAHATHHAILAQNAAAVIANIKWQSQQRKSSQAHSSTKGKIEPSILSQTADASEGDKVYNGEPTAAASLPMERKAAARVKSWHAEFVPLLTTDRPSSSTHTLSKALEQRRPDFIRHSQARVRAVEQRARERQRLRIQTPTPAQRQKDKSHDRSSSGKQHQSRWTHSVLPEAKRRKEEERRKLASQANRQRAELFKKKLLEQVLHRGKD